MKTQLGNLSAPFAYFGGKSFAVNEVWGALGDVKNYVEPFCGSAAMLLGRPKVLGDETINDLDAFVANFWRAVAAEADAVALYADWPCNEADLNARHSWLVIGAKQLREKIIANPDFYDAKIAGWWVWGSCNSIGYDWCDGRGAWVHDGEKLVKRKSNVEFIDSPGISRAIPKMADGVGINRVIESATDDSIEDRKKFINEWFLLLKQRLRNVRVASGDWKRVLTPICTTSKGLTGVFLDPPYTKGGMQYAAGGCGGSVSQDVGNWCVENGKDPLLRIVLCGHDGEHDFLLEHGWQKRKWSARKGYQLSEEAINNAKSETLWCNAQCLPEVEAQPHLF